MIIESVVMHRPDGLLRLERESSGKMGQNGGGGDGGMQQISHPGLVKGESPPEIVRGWRRG